MEERMIKLDAENAVQSHTPKKLCNSIASLIRPSLPGQHSPPSISMLQVCDASLLVKKINKSGRMLMPSSIYVIFESCLQNPWKASLEINNFPTARAEA